jgi:sugar/nucleoside kinase (ribokinase family)
MEKIQIVCAGHVCIDLTPTFLKNNNADMKDILVPGKLINVSDAKISTGGSVPNVGIALSLLGIDTKLMGKIGSDPFGDIILKLLKEKNIQESMIVAEDESTSYSVVLAPPGIDRIFLHNPGTNDTFCSDDIDYETVRNAQIFHFGYPPLMKRMHENGGAELIKTFKKVKELGVTTSLDMSLPDVNSDSGLIDWESMLKELLPYVDIFTPSIEEILFMILREEYISCSKKSAGGDFVDSIDLNILQTLGEKLTAYGVKIAAVKCGKKGFYVRTGDKSSLMNLEAVSLNNIDNWSDRELFEETFNVQDIVSTTGAGDSSIAGFLAAILSKKTVEDAARIACAVASCRIQSYDAFTSIKPLAETFELIEKGWCKDRISLDGTNWKFDKDEDIWIGSKDSAKSFL